MTKIPAVGGDAKIHSEVAVSWSIMVQAASKVKDFELDFFRITSTISGYRDYDGQIRYKKKYGSWAATPGESNHGWGVSMDFSRRKDEDEKTGIAHSKELKWLEANANRFGFEPLLGSPKQVKDENGKLVNNYHETWHWTYMNSNK